MEEQELELRMYFFVPYQLTGIQQGIQCGHTALEYAHRFGKDDEFVKFVEQYKTWVVLNGGTTNDERNFDDIAMGTLNQIADGLVENIIKFSFFREPDFA